MVLLGEGGRVQIAVLCSTLGFGYRAMRVGLPGLRTVWSGWRVRAGPAMHAGWRSYGFYLMFSLGWLETAVAHRRAVGLPRRSRHANVEKDHVG